MTRQYPLPSLCRAPMPRKLTMILIERKQGGWRKHASGTERRPSQFVTTPILLHLESEMRWKEVTRPLDAGPF